MQARRAAASHDLSSREHRYRERLDMALRLVAWLRASRGGKPVRPLSLAEAAAYQVADGSFIDWARLSLRAGGPVRELSETYTRLSESAFEKSS